MSRFTDDTFAKWVDWVTRLDPEISKLRFRRVVWRGTIELIQENEIDTTYLSFLTQLYVDGQAMAVRRLATSSGDSISMARLLEQMAQLPNVITADRVIARGIEHDPDLMFRAEREKWAMAGFETWTIDGSTLDPGVVRGHLDELREDARKVVEFANRTIAHIDRRGWDDTLTFGELNDNITRIGELHAEYYMLLTGAWKAYVTPVIQGD